MARRNSALTGQPATPGFELYQAIGGRVTCRKLSVALYARVEQDPLLRPLFPGKTLRCAIEEFAAFLSQFLGGPSEDAQRRWWLSLRESHLRFEIGEKERSAWMKNMLGALDDVQIAEPVRGALSGFFERASAYIVNTEQSGPVSEHRSDAANDDVQREIARRWDMQRRLDETVAAVRDGEAARAIVLVETLEAWFRRDHSVCAALLALMIGQGERVMLEYVQEKLLEDPVLVRERYSGRTLLHAAAAAGTVTTVELLLRLGADPNVIDVGGHTPLYCVGNECVADGGASVVHVLVQGGANPNAQDGVKRCTALHMAARRGRVAVAEALVNCGANIEARDSLGDTPLRRAVNCGKVEVARLLLSRGADVHSKGNESLTPLLAARTGPMTRLLQSAAEK